jgi:hypothetical protein
MPSRNGDGPHLSDGGIYDNPELETRAAAEAFLGSWNFQAYIEAFRSGKTQSRHGEISAEFQEAEAAPAHAMTTTPTSSGGPTRARSRR